MPSRVQIVVTVDEKDAERGVKKVRSAFDGMGATSRRVTTDSERGFRGMTRSITGGVLAAGLLATAFLGVGSAALRVARDSAILSAQNETLSVAMGVVARNTGVSITLLNAQELALRSMGLTTKVTRRILTRFAATGLPVERVQELVDTARNLAQVMGVNTSEAAERLTRAIISQEVEILRTAGLNVNFEQGHVKMAAALGKTSQALTLSEKNIANFNIVVEQNEKLQGVYETALDTTGKKLSSLPRLFENASEALGQKFTPALDLAITRLSEFLKLADEVLRADAAFEEARRGFERREGFSFNDVLSLVAGLDIGTLALSSTEEAAAAVEKADRLFADILERHAARTVIAGAPDFQIPTITDREGSIVGLGTSVAAQKAINNANQVVAQQDEARADAQEKITKALRQQERLLKEIERIDFAAQIDQADEVTRVVLETGATIERLQEIRERDPELAAKAQEAIVRVTDAGSQRLREIFEGRAAAEVETSQRAADERQKIRENEVKLREREAAEIIAIHERVEASVTALERSAAFAGADIFERIELERLATIERIESDVNATTAQIERARVAANAVAGAAIRDENERIADEQLRNFERQGREYDRLLDRMVRFTEQTGSLLGNIWRTLSQEFQRSVTKMVLGFLFGMRQIQGAGAGALGGGGGGSGGILGGLLGGGLFGGGVAVGATPPFNPNSFVNSAFGGGAADGVFRAGELGPAATAGQAGAIPGATAAGGGGILGGLLGSLSGLFGRPGRGGLGPALGLLLALEGGGRGRPGLAAGLGIGGLLGGVALQGALAGIAGGVGGLAGAGIGLLGFATNPIGLAILGGLAAVGVISGALARGGKKEKATKIANRGFEQMDMVVKAFELRQLSFLSAADSMSRLWDEMVGGWQQIGGSVGSRSIATQRPFFDEKLRFIEMIQGERNRRQDLIDRLPVPEFALGGFVSGAGQSPILAALHAGEFVMSRQAVEEIGRPRLDEMNRGGGAGGDTFDVSIHAVDAASFEAWARREAPTMQRVVVAAVKRDVKERGPLGRLVNR